MSADSSRTRQRQFAWWTFAKQEALFLAWALMEVAILTPIALTVMQWARFWSPALVTLWLLLLILLPFSILRLISTLKLSFRQQQAVMATALLLTVLLAWRLLLYAPRPPLDFGWLGMIVQHIADWRDPLWARDLTIFALVVVGWWRGLRLVQFKPEIDRAGFRLRAGGLILAPMAFVLEFTGLGWSVAPFVLLYFAAGLVAVALIRAEQVERDRSGFAASLRPGWLGVIFATALLTVLAAGLLAGAVAGESASAAVRWLAPLWNALQASAAVALSTVAFLATPFVAVIATVLGFLAAQLSGLFSGTLTNPFTTDPGALGPLITVTPDLAEPTGPTLFSRGATVAVMLLIILLVVLALTRLYREAAVVARESERVTPRRAKQPAPGLGDRLARRLGLWRRWRAAASVRRIYQQMCAAAAGAGWPRGQAETPYEYLDALATVWPENKADSRLITEAYVRVRYGEVPETREELEALREAWDRLLATPPAEAAVGPATDVVARS